SCTSCQSCPRRVLEIASGSSRSRNPVRSITVPRMISWRVEDVRKQSRMKPFLAAALAAASLAATGVCAQGFPSNTVRLVATSTPGSPVDIYARALSDHLAKSLGQTVVVENRAGAGGTLAAGYVLGA